MVAAHVSLMLNVNPTPLGYVSMSKIECEAIAVPYLPLCLPYIRPYPNGIWYGFGRDLHGNIAPLYLLILQNSKKNKGKSQLFSKNFFILGSPQLQLQITIKYTHVRWIKDSLFLVANCCLRNKIHWPSWTIFSKAKHWSCIVGVSWIRQIHVDHLANPSP